jgi:hypothetical protein
LLRRLIGPAVVDFRIEIPHREPRLLRAVAALLRRCRIPRREAELQAGPSLDEIGTTFAPISFSFS